MRFRGMAPLREGFPNVEVSTGNRSFDLHNECVLSSVEYMLGRRVLALRFRCSASISTVRETAEALLVLEVEKVAGLEIRGDISQTPRREEAGGVDFIEYGLSSDGRGRLRFVLDNHAEIMTIGEGCGLRLVRGHAEDVTKLNSPGEGE